MPLTTAAQIYTKKVCVWARQVGVLGSLNCMIHFEVERMNNVGSEQQRQGYAGMVAARKSVLARQVGEAGTRMICPWGQIEDSSRVLCRPRNLQSTALCTAKATVPIHGSRLLNMTAAVAHWVGHQATMVAVLQRLAFRDAHS